MVGSVHICIHVFVFVCVCVCVCVYMHTQTYTKHTHTHKQHTHTRTHTHTHTERERERETDTVTDTDTDTQIHTRGDRGRLVTRASLSSRANSLPLSSSASNCAVETLVEGVSSMVEGGIKDWEKHFPKFHEFILMYNVES